MFGYDSFKNKMKKYSEEKIENVVYASWYGNTIKTIILTFVVMELLFVTISKTYPILYIVGYILVLLLMCLYITTRKAGIALTKNRVICVIFRHIGFKEKEEYEIIKDKIKSISTHKFLTYRFVTISFISENGKFVKKKLFFTSFMIGPGSENFKKDGEKIYQEICDIQKVLDRGDF